GNARGPHTIARDFGNDSSRRAILRQIVRRLRRGDRPDAQATALAPPKQAQVGGPRGLRHGSLTSGRRRRLLFFQTLVRKLRKRLAAAGRWGRAKLSLGPRKTKKPKRTARASRQPRK